MSNPQKIDFWIGGKHYTYLLGTYGLAKLEQRQGKPWPTVMQQAFDAGFGADIVLALFHCGLLLHHEPITEREASILLDELTVPVFSEKFAEAWQRQFGGQDDRARPIPAATAGLTATNGSGIPFSEHG